jgi:CBS domain-containing protein
MNKIRVRDVMTTLVVSFDPKDPIHEAAVRLARNSVSGGPVVENGKVIGVVSEADLIAAAMPPAPVDRGATILDVLTVVGTAKPHHHHHHGKTVGDVMSPFVIDIGPDEPIWSAALRMESKGVKRLPVVDKDGSLVGIISRADLIGALARRDEDIAADVIESIGDLGDETISELDVRSVNGVVTLTGLVDRRTTSQIAVRVAARVMGVVEVIDRLRYEWDDSHVEPADVLGDPWAVGPLVKG